MKVTYDKAIIQLQDITRSYEELEKRHASQTTELHDEQARSQVLSRDLNTLQEVKEQMEINHKKLCDKLISDLKTVDERW